VQLGFIYKLSFMTS